MKLRVKIGVGVVLSVICASAGADLKVQQIPNADAPNGLFSAASIPIINNNGTIAVVAQGGIYISNGGNLTNAFPATTILPGSGGGTFGTFTSINLNDLGQLGIFASPAGTGISHNVGYWLGTTPADLLKIYQVGDLAPSSAGFSFKSSAQPAQSAAALFSADISDGATTRRGVWKASSPTDLANLALSTSQPPGMPAGSTYQNFDSPVQTNASGQALFASQFNGVWRGSQTNNVTPIAIAGQTPPGLESVARFDAFSFASLNDAGNVSFINQPSISATRQAIFSDRSGSLALITKTGIQAPGAPAGDIIAQFTRQWINNAGQIGFKAVLQGPDIVSTNDIGVWLESPSGFRLVAREGDIAPGTSGQKFYSLDAEMINSRGQMIIKASTLTDNGYWAFDPGAGLALITLQSTVLQIGNGETLRPLNLFDDATLIAAGGDGLPRSFNDNGQFVFEATRGGTGGNFVNYGIFAVNVPEPACVIFLALLPVLRRRHR